MIEVRHLTKRYGGRCAVDDLSFTVEDGQIFGFLGPNGAGKSTTMNIMTGYLAATEGDVLIDGHNLLEEPEAAKRCIGYLPEQPPLYDDMTVAEYLRFCAELKQLPKAEREEQVQTALTLTRLEEMAPRLLRNLSKGYRQRAGLAQAILGLPRIILLDEPTVGLDPKQVVEIRQLIRRLGQDRTVLLSSHILSEIRAVCGRVLILRKGRLVACDTPENLERTLTDQGALELLVQASGEEAAGLVGAVPGVTGWSVLEEAGGAVRLAVRGDGDLRAALFYACADARRPLLELRPRTATLEQAFLDLTDDDDAVAAQAAALLRGGASAPEEEARDESGL